MNDQSRRLQEMLERATAAGNDMPADLDAETASLREGWLALGELLEAAQPASGQSLENWKVTVRPAPRRWPLALVAAIAVSVLLAIGLTLAYRMRDGSSTPQPNPPAMARDDRSATGSGAGSSRAVARALPSAARTPNAEQRTLNRSDLAWENSLDEEIEAVSQAAALVRQDWYAGVGHWSAIERGFEEIKKDIEDGTL